jgi:hypothetical protein
VNNNNSLVENDQTNLLEVLCCVDEGAPSTGVEGCLMWKKGRGKGGSSSRIYRRCLLLKQRDSPGEVHLGSESRSVSYSGCESTVKCVDRGLRAETRAGLGRK